MPEPTECGLPIKNYIGITSTLHCCRPAGHDDELGCLPCSGQVVSRQHEIPRPNPSKEVIERVEARITRERQLVLEFLRKVEHMKGKEEELVLVMVDELEIVLDAAKRGAGINL